MDVCGSLCYTLTYHPLTTCTTNLLRLVETLTATTVNWPLLELATDVCVYVGPSSKGFCAENEDWDLLQHV